MVKIQGLQVSILNNDIADGIALFVPEGLTTIRHDIQSFLNQFHLQIPQNDEFIIEEVQVPVHGITHYIVCVDNQKRVVDTVERMREQVFTTLEAFEDFGIKRIAMNGIRFTARPNPNVRPEELQRRFVEEYFEIHRRSCIRIVYLIDKKGGFNSFSQGIDALLQRAEDCFDRDEWGDLCHEGIQRYLQIKRLYEVLCQNPAGNIDELWQRYADFYVLPVANRPENPNRGTFNALNYQAILRNNTLIPISDAIQQIRNNANQVQLSFASKALHTIDNSYPIFDKYVGLFFNIAWPLTQHDMATNYAEEKYDFRKRHAVACYESLRAIYENRSTNGLNRILNKFTEHIQHAVDHYNERCNAENLEPLDIHEVESISEVKKIDFVIWAFREQQEQP